MQMAETSSGTARKSATVSAPAHVVAAGTTAKTVALSGHVRIVATGRKGAIGLVAISQKVGGK
jgi:hypothetical protein